MSDLEFYLVNGSELRGTYHTRNDGEIFPNTRNHGLEIMILRNHAHEKFGVKTASFCGFLTLSAYLTVSYA